MKNKPIEMNKKKFFKNPSSIKRDVISGFLVFLLALPLSLGIARASGFPAAMGVLSAMIGGLTGIFFKVSELSIKGPAAGLITVAASAINDFGGEQKGWQIACAVIVVMSVIQIVFGLLKFGSMSDFFPHSAVHGMLAAIGLIIIAKQIPVLLGDDPTLYKGKSPVELFLDLPKFVLNAHWHIAAIGFIGLSILFAAPFVKIKWLRSIPAPMLVLLVSVPLTVVWHFKETEPDYSLVTIGDFWGNLSVHVDFSAVGTLLFWKYVLMFLFVSTVESLLTVKAVDSLDPLKRQSDYNGDLIGQGSANFLSGLFGGLPVISEVVRSTSNIGFGAVSKWSNFFHGMFLLLAMAFFIPVIELIPNSALAAMLIYAGYRLSAPKEFVHIYKIGKEQLTIFIVTIAITIYEDLLLGVLAGIVVKLLFHISNGASVRSLFTIRSSMHLEDEKCIVSFEGSAVFSNLIAYKKVLSDLPKNCHLILNFEKVRIIDHSFMLFIHRFATEERLHRSVTLAGMDAHVTLSDHPLATRVLKSKIKS